MKTTDQVLDRAAELLLRDGWVQPSLPSGVVTPGNNPEGAPACAAIALANAAGEIPASFTRDRIKWEAWSALAVALGYEFNPTEELWLCTKANQMIWGWNDTPGRTRDEVVAMLRAVAASERARQGRLLPVILAKALETEAAQA